MNNLNSVILEGAVNKDTVSFNDSFGIIVLGFTLETVRDPETYKFDVECFGKLASVAHNTFEKSLIHKVRVVGRLKKLSNVVVVAEHIEFKD